MDTFSDLKLSEPLARALRELGFTKPTPIQAQALPILLAAPTDFIGLAATGTGKTAAFGIPLLESVDPAKKQVQAVVLAPTRELALQVAGQLNLLGKHKGIKALPVYGGTGYGPQLEGLKRGAHVVVGTPGRVIDHISRRSMNLQEAKVVVLDEADEMISMGFKDDLESILRATDRRSCNIWLFSATMSGPVRRVADTYLREPKQAQVNRTEMLSNTVEQFYYVVRESDKPDALCRLIEASDDFYGLVFCQTKALVVNLTQFLLDRNYKADCLHGDKAQDERERTMRAFRDKKLRLLVCTDVASRGLDVKDLTHVINYSIPRELELYVHRIGRTARSGKAGIAMSLVTPANRILVDKVEKMTKSRLVRGEIPGRRDVAAKKVARALERFLAEKNHERAADLLGSDWQAAVEDMPLDEIIGRFLAMLDPEVFGDEETRSRLPAAAPKPGPGAKKKSRHR